MTIGDPVQYGDPDGHGTYGQLTGGADGGPIAHGVILAPGADA